MTARRALEASTVGALTGYHPPVSASHKSHRAGTAELVIVAVAWSGATVVTGLMVHRLPPRRRRRCQGHGIASAVSMATGLRRQRLIAVTTGGEHRPLLAAVGFDPSRRGQRQPNPFDERRAS